MHTTRNNNSWRKLEIEQLEQNLRIEPVCRVTVATNGTIWYESNDETDGITICG